MWFIRVCNIGLDLENCDVFKGCNFWSLLGGVSNAYDMAFAHGGSSEYQNIITIWKLVDLMRRKWDIYHNAENLGRMSSW